ncbi:MAG: hypothetical protein WDM89_08405 [Rhizomicrobium sp.]
MQSVAEDQAEHVAYSRRVHLNFTADWSALAGDARLRALCFDALQNTARGIERFVSGDKARSDSRLKWLDASKANATANEFHCGMSSGIHVC